MTGTEGSRRTVHFPPGEEPAGQEPKPNALEAYATAVRETELTRKMLRGLLQKSYSRHGELQVILRSSIRTQEAVRLLLEMEEQS